MSIKDLKQRRKELYWETQRLQASYLSIDKTDKKSKETSFKLKNKENEVYKKQMFYSNLIKEMEKNKNE
jgi:hypothetical protein